MKFLAIHYRNATTRSIRTIEPRKLHKSKLSATRHFNQIKTLSGIDYKKSPA